MNPSSTEYGELKDIFGNNYNNFTKIIKVVLFGDTGTRGEETTVYGAATAERPAG